MRDYDQQHSRIRFAQDVAIVDKYDEEGSLAGLLRGLFFIIFLGQLA